MRYFDRYQDHARHCAACRGALARARALERAAPLMALLPLALSSSRAIKVAGVLAFLAARGLSAKVARAVNGPDASRGELFSSAQFAPDNPKVVKRGRLPK